MKLNIKPLAKLAKVTVEHLPEILTAVGIVSFGAGMAVTYVNTKNLLDDMDVELAHKIATEEATAFDAESFDPTEVKLTPKELTWLVVRNMWGTALCFAAGTFCVLEARHIDGVRAAAEITALAGSVKFYREKLGERIEAEKEALGQKKFEDINTRETYRIAEQTFSQYPELSLPTTDGKNWFVDGRHGGRWRATYDEVTALIESMNSEIKTTEDPIWVPDFRDRVSRGVLDRGSDAPYGSDYEGWNISGNHEPIEYRLDPVPNPATGEIVYVLKYVAPEGELHAPLGNHYNS